MLPLELIYPWRLQAHLRMMQHLSEVHILRVLEVLPQQGGVPVKIGNYKWDFDTL